MNDVETSTTPPDIQDDDGEDIPSARVSVYITTPADTLLEASVQVCGEWATDPQAIADSILRAALAVAGMHGPDVAWALRGQLAEPKPR